MPSAAPCPVCKRPVPADAQAHRPFCSQRCKTIDLGSWLTGAYRISRPVEEEDLDEGQPGGSGVASEATSPEPGDSGRGH